MFTRIPDSILQDLGKALTKAVSGGSDTHVFDIISPPQFPTSRKSFENGWRPVLWPVRARQLIASEVVCTDLKDLNIIPSYLSRCYPKCTKEI